MGSVTSSPRPDEPGWHATRRADTTDPDLAPVPPHPARQETGHLPAYADDVDGEVDHGVDGPVDADGDPEAVEDGLQGSREPGAAAVAARLGRRPRDMVMSIGVLLLVVFGLFGLYRFLGGDEAARIDPAAAYAEARRNGAFPVSEPAGLPAGWRPVSAVYQPQAAGAVLRVGWRTPDDGTMQLVEGNLAQDVLLRNELGDDARQTGEEQIGGRTWQAFDARKGERALVLREAGRMIIIVGRAQDTELKEFAAALK